MARPKLALVDGHAVAFRAFHALRDAQLRTADGEPTFAVFGFMQIVLTTLQQLQPEYVAVSFDVGRTFRDDLYAEYKAGRAETPSDFHPQLKRIQQVVRALNIPIYTVEGFEADDVIGTLSRQATAKDVDTYIVTGDSDTLQLVDDHVRVLLAVPYGRKQEAKEYDRQAVIERYKGLRPDQLADLRGLKGDASDNIPGVRGIGETGAISLLKEWGTVDGIYDHLDEVPNRYRKALDGQREAALFSKQLATIHCDVPIELHLDDCRVAGYDRDAVIELFQELQFGSLVRKLPASDGSTAEGLTALPDRPGEPAAKTSGPSGAPQQIGMFDDGDAARERAAELAASAQDVPQLGTYRAVRTPDELAALVEQLQAADWIAFDTETSSLDARTSELVGLSFAVRPGEAWYVPIGHKGEDAASQLGRDAVREALLPVLEDGSKAKVGHNAKFDVIALRTLDIVVRGVTWDTLIAAQLLGNHAVGLKDLAFNVLRLSQPMTEITELIGSGRNQISFDYVPIELAVPYAAADADMTLRLRERQDTELDKQPRVRSVFADIEMPLLPVLADMEWHGIKVDVDVLRQLAGGMEQRIGELEAEIYAIAEGPFNVGSGQQLNQVLFERLKLPADGLSRTKNGLYSITAEVLDRLSNVDPTGIVTKILEYRQLTKLKSTYLDAIPGLVDQHNRVHTDFKQIGSATGRLASTNPNLMNVPVRTDQGREIRRAFIAEPGYCLLSADYSQMELRLLAHLTQDPPLVQVFREGRDIHAATAARLFGVPEPQVSKNQRRIAKCVAAGTLVSTDRGIVPIEQLGSVEPGEVTGLDCIVAQEGVRRAETIGFYYGDVQPTIRITTERGYVLEATGRHRIRSIDANGDYVWRRLDELEVGSNAALARGGMLFGRDEPFSMLYQRRDEHKRGLTLPERMTTALARFLGYFVAEGYISNGRGSRSVTISNTNPDVLDDLRRIGDEVFDKAPHAYADVNLVTTLRWHSSRLADLLEYLGVGDGAANKRIPDVVMRGSQEVVAAFLRAFFEGDGSISKHFISAGSKSETLIRQLQALLLNFGVVCHLEHRDIERYGRHYKLRLIGRESRENFARYIGVVSRRKLERLALLATRIVTNEAVTLPLQRERLLRLYPQTKRELKETIHMCVRTKSPIVGLTYRRLDQIITQFPHAGDIDIRVMKAHQNRNLFYDRVASIEYSSQQVYDLVVPDTNTYIANGFVSHNTTIFGSIYGISSFGLSARTELNRKEAQELIDGLFATYPGLRKLFDETLVFGREHGYVETLFGRRRYFGSGQSNVLSAKGPQRAAAEREAINAPIQGTSADLVKMAMNRLWDELNRRGLGARLLLQVHDELLLEVPDDELDDVKQLVREVMEHVYPELSVPLEVGIGTGRNWEEMG